MIKNISSPSSLPTGGLGSSKRGVSHSPEDQQTFYKRPNMDSPFVMSPRIKRSPTKASTASTSANGVPSQPPTSSSIIYNVDTQNKFNELNTASANDSTGTKLLNKPKQHIPPFTVVGAIDFKKAIDIVAKIAKNEHTVRYMSVGTKIQVHTQSIYDKIHTEFITNNIKFFSHDLIGLKQCRFAISGLPRMNVEDIENELRRYNLEFLTVFAIKPKTQRFNEEYIYIVNFKMNTVNLNSLNKIKTINHTVIKWFKPSNNSKGPTQCRNCFMFGHGMRNCNLNKKCMKCGELTHESDQCNAQSAKCANCGEKHQADDPSCSTRGKFIEMRTKLSSANQKIRQKPKAKDIVVNDTTFPRLNKMHHQHEEKTHQWPFSYGNRVTFNKIGGIDSTPGSSKQSSQPSNELFSVEEIMSITKDVFTGLKLAKSKEEQLEVIFRIAANYIYGSNP